MSIIQDLITDRTQADVNRVRELALKGWANLTEEEKAEWNAGMKGAYNATDLNRVTQAMDYINAELEGYGYVTGYQKVEVPHEAQPVSPLPDGYVQLEYIESTGTQYIDTGFKPNQNSRICMDAYLVERPSQYAGYFGARTGSTNQMWVYWRESSEDFSARYNTVSLVVSASLQQHDEIDFNKNVITINGVSETATAATFQSAYSVFLFCVNSQGSTQYPSSLRLYSCQIYDNGALVRDFVPCADPSNVAGLYDLVNGVFYGNSGTGTFTAGPEVDAPPAPDEPGEELDPYTWYIQDIPTQSQMQAYLANVQALRNAFTVPDSVPPVPADMEGLTYQEANDIERIILAIDALITNMMDAWFYSNEVFCGEV